MLLEDVERYRGERPSGYHRLAEEVEVEEKEEEGSGGSGSGSGSGGGSGDEEEEGVNYARLDDAASAASAAADALDRAGALQRLLSGRQVG